MASCPRQDQDACEWCGVSHQAPHGMVTHETVFSPRRGDACTCTKHR